MKQCLTCKGVVPPALEACPNCEVELRSGRRLLKVAGLVALVASGCNELTPVPVYGGPPPPPAAKPKKALVPPGDQEKPDGGSP